jgi:hypothetical protein
LARLNAGNISGNAIYVNGFENVSRSFARVSKAANSNLRNRLKEAAEPVREAAQEYGPGRIRNLKHGSGPSGANWGAVRIGVTQRAVYIAPVERGRGTNEKRRRPNFKTLMLERAYEPAVADHRTEVVDRLGRIFDDIQHAWRA